VKRIAGCITTGVISFSQAASAGIVALTPAPGWVKVVLAVVWLPLTALLFWISWRWPVVEHRHESYRVDDLGIEIRRGVVWRTVLNVARSRVQHTDVSQGPLERRFGLGTLKIHTAGTENAEIDVHGLAHETALLIRDHLVRARGDDAV
jgi:membrane protein YdbS with pleckstrin-like domain